MNLWLIFNQNRQRKQKGKKPGERNLVRALAPHQVDQVQAHPTLRGQDRKQGGEITNLMEKLEAKAHLNPH